MDAAVSNRKQNKGQGAKQHQLAPHCCDKALNNIDQNMAEFFITFIAGLSYGMTTVLVGQPLDTIKTRMQGMPSASHQSAWKLATDLFRTEGVRGLYRGGLPLFLGGSLMRSAQFGVSGRVKHWLEDHPEIGHYRIFGVFDWQVIVAGAAGGVGRGFVEIPTDFIKIRRQVDMGWTFSHIYDGFAITLMRNIGLFTFFVMYIDLSKQACRAGYVPSVLMNETNTGLTPFAKGALCANLAWLSVWPMDVIKSQRQSGLYDEKNGLLKLWKENSRNGRLFRGIVPGLLRSSIANGSSMVVYEKVQTILTRRLGLERKDIA